MAINVNTANNQAGQLSTQAGKLREAVTQLNAYKNSLAANWQGQEVTSIMQAIDRSISDISQVIRQMESLGSDIKGAAQEIHREEQARIQRAQNALNQAERVLSDLIKEQEKIKNLLKNATLPEEVANFTRQINDLAKRITEQEGRCRSCRSALDAARR